MYKLFCVTIFLLKISVAPGTYVRPDVFLDARLAKGFWISKEDIQHASALFEGGWVWTESKHLLITHVCRAKTMANGYTVEPGELLNGTCYIAGNTTLSSLSGVQEYKDYEVLLKLDDEVYEWVNFDKETGDIPHGTVIGGIGSYYEPILICRRYYNATAGNLKASKAVLGKFSPKDGQCYYEVEFGSKWVKWDLAFRTENFQLLVLKAKGKPDCPEPRSKKLEQTAESKQQNTPELTALEFLSRRKQNLANEMIAQETKHY